jgi:hypothetical protein
LETPPAKKHGCLKIGLVLVAIVLVVLGILFGIGVYHTGAVDRDLTLVSATLNKKLPVYLDDNTRLDSTSAGPGRVLHYHCTVLLWAPQWTHESVATFAADMREGLLEKARNNPATVQGFVQNGVSLEYDYTDQGATPIAQVVLTPDDLK